MDFLEPRCFPSSRIRACFTTRADGHSSGPWKSFNLALHVGDAPDAVMRNRALLRDSLQLPNDPFWLDQPHGQRVLHIDQMPDDRLADASISTTVGQICAVLAADCLPILICDRLGSQVAAVHAGWRGLQTGLISNTVNAFSAKPDQLIAWIGPAININSYQVGEDLRNRFIRSDGETAASFRKYDGGWLLDLGGLAYRQLERVGVSSITSSELCVYERHELFYSYRRDGPTGRMAALIWILPHSKSATVNKAEAEPTTA